MVDVDIHTYTHNTIYALTRCWRHHVLADGYEVCLFVCSSVCLFFCLYFFLEGREGGYSYTFA